MANNNHPNRNKERARFMVLAYSLFPGVVLRCTDRPFGEMYADMQLLAPTNRAQLMDALEQAHANKQALEGNDR